MTCKMPTTNSPAKWGRRMQPCSYSGFGFRFHNLVIVHVVGKSIILNASVESKTGTRPCLHNEESVSQLQYRLALGKSEHLTRARRAGEHSNAELAFRYR